MRAIQEHPLFKGVHNVNKGKANVNAFTELLGYQKADEILSKSFP